MLRRKTNISSGNAPLPSNNTASTSTPSRRRTNWGRQSLNHQRSTSVDIGIAVLLVLALVLSLATYLFPKEVSHVEQQAEDELMQMWHHHQPPVSDKNTGGGDDADAIPRLDQMSTKWVDGEKKLKKRLEILAQRQSEGKDIGVPVLTRWLGEDIPAWPTDPDNTMELEIWKKKVEEKYAEMRAEEMEWRSRMTQFLDEERG